MPIVYLDILLAVNWFIDTLLLSATARVLRLTPRRFRVVLGGLSGGITACALFLLSLPTPILLILHVFGAALMTIIAFSPSGWKRLVLRMTVLYCFSALFSGVVTVLQSFINSDFLLGRNGVVYFDISPLTLALLASVSYGFSCLYEYITRKRAPEGHELELCIRDQNGTCACRAFYDTGLQVTEPFSGSPVVIVEREKMRCCISSELFETLCRLDSATDVVTKNRVRMVPYHAMGTDGLLPAFIPQKVELRSANGDTTDISGTYVALSDGLLRGEYDALVGSDSLRKG